MRALVSILETAHDMVYGSLLLYVEVDNFGFKIVIYVPNAAGVITIFGLILSRIITRRHWSVRMNGGDLRVFQLLCYWLRSDEATSLSTHACTWYAFMTMHY